MALQTRTVRWFHRWMSLVFSIALLSLSMSAMYYVYASTFRAPAPQARPAHNKLDLAQVKLGLNEAALKSGVSIEKVQSQRLIMVDGAAWYVFQSSESPKPFYVHAGTGEKIERADERYAEQLATEQAGGAKLGAPTVVNEYSTEYPAGMKALPVYRFDLSDASNMRLYVSTARGQVVTHVDDLRASQLFIFNNMHKMMFIKDKLARDIFIFVIGLALFVVSVTGIVLFAMTMPRRKLSEPETSLPSTPVKAPESAVTHV